MTVTSTTRKSGMGLVLAGLVTFVLSSLVSGGFVRGLFQGMTVALMVLAAYLLGTQWRTGRTAPGAGERDPDGLWLPSEDEHRG